MTLVKTYIQAKMQNDANLKSFFLEKTTGVKAEQTAAKYQHAP